MGWMEQIHVIRSSKYGLRGVRVGEASNPGSPIAIGEHTQ